MHITDWFSTTWNSVLGHKSSGIVDDFYWQPDQYISGYLSGNFDPNNTGSYNGGTDYNNLKDGDDLCVFNGMSFVTGSGIGHPCYFESDGSDDFIGTCSLGGGGGGGYTSNFSANLNSDFTISIWTSMETVHESFHWSLGHPWAIHDAGQYPGIALETNYDELRLIMGNGSGYESYYYIGDGDTATESTKHGKSSIQSNRWYYLTFVYDSLRSNGDVYQFYIDGVRARVYPNFPEWGYSGEGIQQLGIGIKQTMGSPFVTTAGHKFGHVHYYQTALKHSEIRQNYLATNQHYYRPGSGYIQP